MFYCTPRLLTLPLQAIVQEAENVMTERSSLACCAVPCRCFVTLVAGMLKHCSLERFLKKNKTRCKCKQTPLSKCCRCALSPHALHRVSLALLKNRFPVHFYSQEREAAWLHAGATFSLIRFLPNIHPAASSAGDSAATAALAEQLQQLQQLQKQSEDALAAKDAELQQLQVRAPQCA